MECWVVLEAEHVFAKQDRLLIAKYLKWMLAHRMNTEWLFCCLVPVAYAHRQRSVALRAKTKQTDLYGRSTTKQTDLYGRSTTKQTDLYGRSTTKQPYARSSPSPPRPLFPSQSPGGEGGPSGL
jgi:hypothetical protein